MQRGPDCYLAMAALILSPFVAAQVASAQITNEISATVNHPFIIGNTTLPPGKYNFRMIQGSDMTAMTVRSATNPNMAEDFLVRQSRANQSPAHTELVFNRYGNKEFLTKIYQGGSQIGVAVEEPSRDEVQMQNQGQHAYEHTEEQSQ